MATFDKEQALLRHIHLSDAHEEQKKELIAEGYSSDKLTDLNEALSELAKDALYHGYVFVCWENDAGEFTHTIEEASIMDYAEAIVQESALTYKLTRMIERKLDPGERTPESLWEVKQQLLEQLLRVVRNIGE